MSFRAFLQEHFRVLTTFTFLFNITFKNILDLPIHRTKLLLYINTKSDNHVILEIKLSRFIIKLSLKSDLKLLQSVAKILKPSTFMAQLHCNRWSDIADCLMFLRRFPVRLDIPMCSAALV